jgi:CDP-diglyceride synthetase
MDKLAELTHGAKVVLGSAIAYLIISFFNWQEIDLGAFGSAGVSMWHGVGWVAGLLAIAIIAWQAVRLANINVEVGVTPSMITAFLAILLLLFTVIKFFADSEFRTWAAWVGLILAVVVCVGAWMNMQAAGEGFAEVKDKLGSMGSGGGAAGATTETTAPPAEAAPAPEESSGDEPKSS